MNTEGINRRIENHQHDNRTTGYGLTFTLKLESLFLKNSNDYARYLQLKACNTKLKKYNTII